MYIGFVIFVVFDLFLCKLTYISLVVLITENTRCRVYKQNTRKKGNRKEDDEYDKEAV